jgi:DNA-directed RNA polymerase subunit RPC12/RpoP
MALHGGIDGSDPLPPEPVGPRSAQEEHRVAHTTHVASGTLACPRCDAPVAIGAASLAPSDPLGCPYCGHAGAVRDFLSLAAPTRPTRVEVHIVHRGPLTRPRIRRAA